MKWLKIGVIVLLVLVAGASVVLANGAVGLRDGSVLKEAANVTAVAGPQYLDENVIVKVAAAEGKYAVAVAVLNQEVEAVLLDGETKSYLVGSGKPMTLDWTVDELTPERLANLRIFVYAKGWRPVKQPAVALGFTNVTDTMAYETIADFKEYITPAPEE